CCTGQQPSIVAITYYNENIVAPRDSTEHMSRSLEICCFHSFGARRLWLYPLGAMLCSNNIIRYNRCSSKGFAGTQLINSRSTHPTFFNFLMCGSVYTASTVLASEDCWCTG